MKPSRLTRAREMAGLSIAQATRRLSWQGTGLLPELENGSAQPTTSDLHRLANIYGVSVEWLRGDGVELPESTRQVLREVDDTSDRARLTELLEATQGRKP